MSVIISTGSGQVTDFVSFGISDHTFMPGSPNP